MAPIDFRKTYRELTDSQKERIEKIKTAAEILDSLLDGAFEYDAADPRMMAVAKTNLEQSIMWAVKALT